MILISISIEAKSITNQISKVILHKRKQLEKNLIKLSVHYNKSMVTINLLLETLHTLINFKCSQ